MAVRSHRSGLSSVHAAGCTGVGSTAKAPFRMPQDGSDRVGRTLGAGETVAAAVGLWQRWASGGDLTGATADVAEALGGGVEV